MGEKAKSNRKKELVLLWICGGMLAALLACHVVMILSLPSRARKDFKADPAVAQAEPQRRQAPAGAVAVPLPEPAMQPPPEPPAFAEEPQAPKDPLAEAFKDHPVATLKQQNKKVRTPPVVTLARVEKQLVPELELDRIHAEARPDPDQDTVKIVTGFECSTPLKIEKISPTHFAVTIMTETELRNWFMFRLEGVKGKTVRIDIRDAPLNKWWSLNPVYACLTSPDDPADFLSKPGTTPPIAAQNGPLLPDTSGQKWKYISRVWREGQGPEGKGTYCFTQAFEEQIVYVAMRYPYTPKYNEAFLDSLRGKHNVAVHDLGPSKNGRPIRLVEIGTGDKQAKPCILLYAREHATEHDTSWAAEGAIRFLLSDDPKAIETRQKVTVLVLPLLDLDGAAESQFSRLTDSFADGIASPESLAASAFFKKWVDAGMRLDLVLNLHNVESSESTHLMCPMMERESARLAHCQLLHKTIMQVAGEAGYGVAKDACLKSYTLFRLGGFVSTHYGALHMPYEINSQASTRHLSLDELRQLGPTLVLATTDYLLSEDGERLKAEVDHRREERRNWWSRFGDEYADDNAIHAEHWVKVKGSRQAEVGNN